MRAFKIGFVLTLSFMIFLGILSCSFGFFPAPVGPKAPTYPSYSNTSLIGSLSGSSQATSPTQTQLSYDQQMTQYQSDSKKYQEEQKIFIQGKIVPYAQGIFVSWILILIILGIIGILMARFLSELVGGAVVFTGVWSAILGPIGGMIWFMNSLVSSFAKQAEAEFSAQPIFQAVGISTIIGVIVLILLGTFLFPKIKTSSNL